MIFVRRALSVCCWKVVLLLTLGQAIGIATSLPKGRSKGKLQGPSRADKQAQEGSARSVGLNKPSSRPLLKIHTHFLILFSGMGTQQDKSLFMMEVNPGLPQVRGSVSTSAVLWVKVCVQPQPTDLVAHLLGMLQGFAGVLDCPGKSELLAGVQQEKRNHFHFPEG